MNAEHKAEWLKELRSGEWVQGSNVLMNDNDEACCLGVITDIAVRHGVCAPWKQDGEVGPWEIERNSTSLPQSVINWLDIGRSNPMVDYIHDGVTHRVPISLLNDGGIWDKNGSQFEVPKHTFSQIADIIEVQL